MGVKSKELIGRAKYVEEQDVSEEYKKIDKQLVKEIHELVEEGGYVDA